MTRTFASKTLAVVLVLAAFGCAGGQEQASSPDAEEGKIERVGKKLDHVAGAVKEKGDEVGQRVGEQLAKVNDGVKETLGDDPHAPPPRVRPKAAE